MNNYLTLERISDFSDSLQKSFAKIQIDEQAIFYEISKLSLEAKDIPALGNLIQSVFIDGLTYGEFIVKYLNKIQEFKSVKLWCEIGSRVKIVMQTPISKGVSPFKLDLSAKTYSINKEHLIKIDERAIIAQSYMDGLLHREKSGSENVWNEYSELLREYRNNPTITNSLSLHKFIKSKCYKNFYLPTRRARDKWEIEIHEKIIDEIEERAEIIVNNAEFLCWHKNEYLITREKIGDIEKLLSSFGYREMEWEYA